MLQETIGEEDFSGVASDLLESGELKFVVHAHWEPFFEMVEIYNTGGYREKRQTGWICSKCGKGFTKFGHTTYCSNCGAKMDGKEG